MSDYFSTNTLNSLDASSNEISKYYDQGFVFTRKTKGDMIQTRSLRINLKKFKLSSENKRILKKNENLTLDLKKLPLLNYSWEIHYLAKEFYSKKFGSSIMSAAKVKEMFNDLLKSNMNFCFEYVISNIVYPLNSFKNIKSSGYTLCYSNNNIIHYAYPFYDLNIKKEVNMGIAMMTKAIIWAQENNKKYIYLGSITNLKAKYKLQFSGAEWWDNYKNIWSQDLNELKNLLS